SPMTCKSQLFRKISKENLIVRISLRNKNYFNKRNSEEHIIMNSHCKKARHLEEKETTIATATTYDGGLVSSSPAAEDNNTSTTASFLSPNFSEELGNFSVGGEVPVFPGYIRITSMVFCFVILGIGVVGNVMVPIVILKTKDMRNSTNIFLMNLSVADLMVLLVCTPTVLVEVNSKPETWVLGEEMSIQRQRRYIKP
ncbi:hypothetical protein L9F63_016255, partial [Diploptera punctata]